GTKRLSDPAFWADGPPKSGYFRVYNGSRAVRADNTGQANAPPPYLIEALDANGATPATRATNHSFAMSVRYQGNDRGDFFYPGAPPPSPLLPLSPPNAPNSTRYHPAAATNTVYSYNWGEVSYFLRPSVDDKNNHEKSDQRVRLYTLFRRYRPCVPDNAA